MGYMMRIGSIILLLFVVSGCGSSNNLTIRVVEDELVKTPIPGIEVQIKDPIGGIDLLNVSTDANGNIKFTIDPEILEGDSILFIIENPDYFTAWVGISINDQLSELVIPISTRVTTITGLVVDENIQPIPDAEIVLDPNPEGIGRITTDEEGGYRIRSNKLREQKYLISAQANGYKRGSTSVWPKLNNLLKLKIPIYLEQMVIEDSIIVIPGPVPPIGVGAPVGGVRTKPDSSNYRIY